MRPRTYQMPPKDLPNAFQMAPRWPPEATCTKNSKNDAKMRAQGNQNDLQNDSFFIKNRAQNQCRILHRFLIDLWSQNATKFDENRMKSETKYTEKLIVNETLRKRCDIDSDREKPYDSHDFLKLPHRFSIIKSLIIIKKRSQPRDRNFLWNSLQKG